ncbi:hypothetical protein SEEGA711_27335 [Salmonella enterica subsp. enterica serovar Gaminara str. ATCC BAA-711]|nr:hypothetical protein SEEGA711_27335 [Salmonella enterica subsp. enterica serovar Gaminara str. ATCC BAA-711]
MKQTSAEEFIEIWNRQKKRKAMPFSRQRLQ